MIYRLTKDRRLPHTNRWAILAIAASIFIGLLVLPSSVQSKTIFDDDWTPPMSDKPVQPPAQVPPSTQPVTPPELKKPETSVNSPPPTTTVAVPTHRPVPAKADQAKSRKLFKEFYAADLAKRSATARRALATKLLDQAAAVSDAPSDQFVLLVGATQAAREASDLALAFRAADALADAFEVDGLHVKSDAATQMVLHTDSPEATTENCRNGLELVDQLAAAEDLVTALRLLKALQAAAPDAEVRSQIQSRMKEVGAAKAAADNIAMFSQRLKTTPNDPVANQVVGEQLCFNKGDWSHGLPLLAKGSDATTKNLAGRELGVPTDGDSLVAMADGWWAYGEVQKMPEKMAIRSHAQDLYRKAMPAITGLAKIKAEVRLADTQPAQVTDATVADASPNHLPRGKKGTATVPLDAFRPGLVAELFQDTDFSTVVKKRLDRQIYFDWQKLGPDPSMSGENFSIRWTGSLRVAKTGSYTLFVSVDNEVQIWMDGRSVLTEDKPNRSATAVVALTKGLHPIRIDYRNTGAEGYLMLQWELQNGFPRQSLARDVLCHDPATAADAAPATAGWRSELIDPHRGGTPFYEAAPAKTVLVGFELTKWKPRNFVVIKSVRAIYRGATGEVMGAQIGTPEGPITRVVARPGYAVGVVRGNYGLRIDRLLLHFMPLDGNALSASNSYDTPYFGGNGGGKITDAGEGKPIIGIYGVATSEDLCSLGVITKE